MITITVDKGSSSIQMEGTDKENFAEATVIVNALYNAFLNDNPMKGEMFRFAVSRMEYVWKKGGVTEAVTITMPNTGAGK